MIRYLIPTKQSFLPSKLFLITVSSDFAVDPQRLVIVEPLVTVVKPDFTAPT